MRLHMNFRRLNAFTSCAFSSNHSPFFLFDSKRRCQFANSGTGLLAPR